MKEFNISDYIEKSEWFGSENETSHANVECVEILTQNHFKYGSIFVHWLLTQNNNVLMWSSTSGKTLEVNKRYSVKFNVKEHIEWRGTKVTKVKYLKILRKF